MTSFNKDNRGRYFQDVLYGKIYPEDHLWETEIDEDFWDILTCPELQRLRYVRILNTNSLFLSGAANVSRFEHAIGTYHLAKECLKSWPELDPIPIEDQKCFLIASLLHDFKTPPFGHSVEYVEQKEGFKHEEEFRQTIEGRQAQTRLSGFTNSNEEYEYQTASYEVLFLNLYKRLGTILDQDDLTKVDRYVRGDSRLGPLLSSDIDLDNIDYVFRLAYHAGLTEEKKAPLQIAKSLYIKNSKKTIDQEALEYIDEWHETRALLYNQLLLDPGELSAECMLHDCIRYAKKHDEFSIKWSDVDYEFLFALPDQPDYINSNHHKFLFSLDEPFEDLKSRNNLRSYLTSLFEKEGIDLPDSYEIFDEDSEIAINDPTLSITAKNPKYVIKDNYGEAAAFKESRKAYQLGQIASRYITGDLFGCIGLFSISYDNRGELVNLLNIFEDIDKKLELDGQLSMRFQQARHIDDRDLSKISIHPNLDIGKSRRQVELRTVEGDDVTSGVESERMIIGVFCGNDSMDMYHIDDLDYSCRENLCRISANFIKKIAASVGPDPTVKTIKPFN